MVKVEVKEKLDNGFHYRQPTNLTGVEGKDFKLIRTQISCLLQDRVTSTTPLNESEMQTRYRYLSDNAPNLFHHAFTVKITNVPEMLNELDYMLTLLEKTQKKEMTFDEASAKAFNLIDTLHLTEAQRKEMERRIEEMRRGSSSSK